MSSYKQILNEIHDRLIGLYKSDQKSMSPLKPSDTAVRGESFKGYERTYCGFNRCCAWL